MTLLDRVLPQYEVREIHSIRLGVAPERALAAARDVRAEDAPLLRLLFRLRGLPASGAIVDAMLGIGFQLVVEEPHGFAVAGVGRPWDRRGGMRRVDDFAAFDEPGWAKMALVFESDGARLRTETRVLCTDARSRRRFRLYWLFVRPFSGLTRRSWLRATKRRVTSAGPG